MKNEKKPRVNPSNSKIKKEFVVAGLGFLGTILAALISVWGNYAKDSLSINTTKTAEVISAISTYQPDISETKPSDILETSLGSSSWMENFEVALAQNTCSSDSLIVPELWAPNLGSPDSIHVLPNTDTWHFGPGLYKNGVIQYVLSIHNISSEIIWPKISNTFSFTVTRIDAAPLHSDVLLNHVDCGGGTFRYSDSVIYLSPDYISTTQKVVFKDFDYYDLQRGEGETFVFSVGCDGPGVYMIHADIPYTFSAEWKSVNYPFSRYLVCPESFSIWLISLAGGSPAIVPYLNMIWDDASQDYIETPSK